MRWCWTHHGIRGWGVVHLIRIPIASCNLWGIPYLKLFTHQIWCCVDPLLVPPSCLEVCKFMTRVKDFIKGLAKYNNMEMGLILCTHHNPVWFWGISKWVVLIECLLRSLNCCTNGRLVLAGWQAGTSKHSVNMVARFRVPHKKWRVVSLRIWHMDVDSTRSCESR